MLSRLTTVERSQSSKANEHNVQVVMGIELSPGHSVRFAFSVFQTGDYSLVLKKPGFALFDCHLYVASLDDAPTSSFLAVACRLFSTQ